MKTKTIGQWKRLGAVALGIVGCWLTRELQADVLILQNESVVTGKVLQENSSGVLIQMESGTYRYPLDWTREVKKEKTSAPHVSINGQTIPDWAQIVSLLAENAWADNLQQVPATVINYGTFKNVPYLSFRCAEGGYEVNIIGDLSQPAAIQIGAVNYLKLSDTAKSNCVNFICSVLADAGARQAVRALAFDQKQTTTVGNLTVENILPGEMGSYGGWWVSVYNPAAIAKAQASQAELEAITQTPSSVLPPGPTTNIAPAAGAPSGPTTITTTSSQTYNYYTAYPTYWTREELANARPVPTPYAVTPEAGMAPVIPANPVYPRSYTRATGNYDRYRR